eukprot:jgi/Undpi1/9011/HiC_scaffold_26.g11472.m1
MCHAKPVQQRSRLLLCEVDEILMPFFESSPPSSQIAATASSAARIDEAESTQPPGEAPKLEHHPQATPNTRGRSSSSGAGGGARGAIGSAHQHSGGGSASECCSPATVEEYDASRIYRPAKPIPARPGHEHKRIRLTGAIGEFLDGPGIWGDLAVMEGERKQQQEEEEEEEEKEGEEEGGGAGGGGGGTTASAGGGRGRKR